MRMATNLPFTGIAVFLLAGCGTTDVGQGELLPDAISDSGDGASNCATPECSDAAVANGGGDTQGRDDGIITDVAPDIAPAEPPCMELSAAPTTIGPLELGQSAEANVFVENCSMSAPLTVRSWGLTLDSAPSFRFDSPLTLPFIIEPGQNVGVSVFYAPTLVGADEGARFGVSSDAGDEPEYLELQGLSSDRPEECVAAEIVCTIEGDTDLWPVGYVAAFDGVATCEPRFDEGRRGMSFSWNLDSPGDPPTVLSILGQRTAQFGFGEPGIYELSLEVIVDGEPVECGSPSIRYVAKYVGDIVVELDWKLLPGAPTPQPGPGPDGPDMDLHLTQTERGCWGDDFYDCHDRNPRPDWGQLGEEADDATLVVSSTSLDRLEAVTLRMPESTTYAVGVDYFNDRSWGDATASVNIYIDDVLAFTAERTLSAAEFWHVADIDGALGLVNSVDQPYRNIGTPQCD